MGEAREETAAATVPAEWTAGLLYFLRMFVRIRWGAAAAVCCTLAFSQFVLGLELPYLKMYGIGGMILLYNIGFVLFANKLKGLPNWPFLETLGQRRTVRLLALLQLNLDFLAIFGLLLCSGGVGNPFVLLFTFHVIVASIVLRRVLALAEVLVAATLIFALVFLEKHGCMACATTFDQIVSGAWGAEWILAYGRPVVMTVTLGALFMLTSAIVKEYARRRKMVVELSRDLESKNAQLKRIDDMRRGLLTVATHDMKAPLSTIGSYLMAMKGGYVGKLEGPQVEIVEKTLGKVDQLNAFISDVLSFQSIDRGEMQQNIRHIDPGKLLAEVVDSFAQRALQEEIELVTRDLDSHHLVEADGNRLAQVFDNLVSNAIKYTPEGGKVEITGEDIGDRVVFTIRDTGVGIDQEDQEHIFDEFFRSRKVRSRFQGTGMGLAIVRRIVEAHGGRVWVESEPGEGSRFHVELPIWRG